MKLNNIIKIEWAKATTVAAAVSRLSGSMCSVGEIAWKTLDIQVPARMTVEDVVEDKDLLRSTELVFRGCDDQLPACPVCFRLTLHDGSMMLVGDGERPHLVVTSKSSHPDNVTDSQLTEYRVLRKSKYRPLAIISH